MMKSRARDKACCSYAAHQRSLLSLAVSFVLCLLLPSGAMGQKPAPALSPTRAINSYVKQIDQFIKRTPKKHRIFGDVASGRKDEPSRWQEFKSEAEREKADTGENLNESAYVWLKAGKVVSVNLTLQSPSGDWVHFVMYYFREAGTLAKIQAQLNTFYGDVTVRREEFYSADGKLLRTNTKHFDLNSQKPKKPDRDLPDFPIPVYLRVQDLPFYKLL